MKRLYEWKQWFTDGRVILVHGQHYQCSQSSFSQQIRNAANRLGLYVEITDLRDRFLVVVVGHRSRRTRRMGMAEA